MELIRKTYQGSISVNAVTSYDLFTYDLSDFKNCIIKCSTNVFDALNSQSAFIRENKFYVIGNSLSVTPLITYTTNDVIFTNIGGDFVLNTLNFSQSTSVLRQRIDNTVAFSRDLDYNIELVIIDFD